MKTLNKCPKCRTANFSNCHSITCPMRAPAPPKKEKRHAFQKNLEAFMLRNGKTGQHFYTDKKDKDMTALSVYYNRKIATENFLLVSSAKSEPTVQRLIKVTLL